MKIYLAKLFLKQWLFVLVGFLSLILILDIMSNSDKLIDLPGNVAANIFTYMGLRAPILFVRIFPFTVLLATLIMFISLMHRLELISLLGMGMSQLNILTALVPVGVLIAGLHFIVDDQIATRAITSLKAWGIAEDDAGGGSNGPTGTWIQFQNRTLQIARIESPVDLRDIKVILRDRDDQVVAMVRAKRARYAEGTWRLETATRHVVQGETAPMATADVLAGLDPAWIRHLQADPDELDIVTLIAVLSRSVATSRPAYIYTLEIHRRLAQPAFAIAIFLLVIPLFQQFTRHERTVTILFGGIVGGFVFFTFDSFMVALGEAGLLPAAVAAWTALVVFSLVGAYLAIRRESL